MAQVLSLTQIFLHAEGTAKKKKKKKKKEKALPPIVIEKDLKNKKDALGTRVSEN